MEASSLKKLEFELSERAFDAAFDEVKADYQLHAFISEGDVEETFEMFDAYLSECRRLLEVVS